MLISKIRDRIYEIIFEADTKAGRLFDIALLVIILISVIFVMLESVPGIRQDYHQFFVLSEWIITGVFTLEYILRIIIVKKPWRYIFSFYGIIDFLAIIPSYLGLFAATYQSLIIIRIFRMLRVFRVFKLTRYSFAGRTLIRALWASREKISVFIFFVIILVVIIGTLMYLIEGEQSGFKSIPLSIYWAIVTLTTVGYGDISPVTPLGQFLASIVMILGYAIIAVPTGIVTAEMMRHSSVGNSQVCQNCLHSIHDDDAIYCKKCGSRLNP
ncbi:MAG: ion transporter [Prolixibacteraceae bacterium]|nr:ion transporter [Prolixibacteraceae bacterium]